MFRYFFGQSGASTFRKRAFIAQMTVLADIKMAPTAGLRTKPNL